MRPCLNDRAKNITNDRHNMRVIRNSRSIQENYATLTKLIGPITDVLKKDEAKNRKKIIEVCHAGKFLMLLGENLIIESYREQPDFTLRKGNQVIGLEHQVLIDPKAREIEGIYENIFQKAEIEIKQDPSYPLFHSNCDVIIDENISLAHKSVIIDEIKRVVKIFLGTHQVVPNRIISSMDIMPHTEKSITPNFGSWWQSWVTDSLLLSAIQHKELKLPAYRHNTVPRQWLLIVIGSLNRSSFEVQGDIELGCSTEFEKIFLLEDFKNTLYELK